MPLSKKYLFFIAILTILITSSLVIFLNYDPSQFLHKIESEKAINQAQYLYKIQKSKGQDFSFGPCLSDSLMKGWVVDIVHNPRNEIDDLIENQCQSYIDGRASHFVELDTMGNFVQSR